MKTGHMAYDMKTGGMVSIDVEDAIIIKSDSGMYKDAGDEIVKAWNDFDGYLKRHPEVWQALADKLWDGFVNYKDVPFGDKEIWHEQKNG